MKHEYQQLYTEAGEKLKNDPSVIPWDVYPRPHMRRRKWMNLNGIWSFRDGDSIRVPFCAESLLAKPEGGSFGSQISCLRAVSCRRTFAVPSEWRGKRVLMHLTVSREFSLRINGKQIAERYGERSSAYFPVTVDITDSLIEGENSVEVNFINDLDPAYPYGKQKIKRGGMWYTPCSGIWQTVWLEPVPEKHISDIECFTEDGTVNVYAYGADGGTVVCEGREYRFEGEYCRISFASPRMWSPEEPNLYEFTVRSGEDEVRSYFAFRTVETKTVGGKPRLLLNGKPYFFHGLLDQGYYSDGLWTPAEPEEYVRDIMKMKSLGFSTLRKHIKIEPELFYYYCDKLGMAVFQDMVNNGKYSFFRDTVLPTLGITRLSDRRRERKGDPETHARFDEAMHRTVLQLRCHPSVVAWTIFNEGWGQFGADGRYDALRQLDDTRIIDATSGWFHRKKTDVDSLHIYFKKLRLGKRRQLPQVISEFGGYVLKIPEHSFNLNKTYGYKLFSTREEFVSALRKLYLEEVVPLAERGLSASILTQVSDVEDETNGLLTFDRRVMKLAPEEFADIADALRNAVEEK